MNFDNIRSRNNLDVISIIILLIPTFIVLGNLTINLSCLIVIIFGISKFFKKLKGYFLFYKKSILFLLIFFFINISFSSDFFLSLKGFLGLFRYILFSAILYIWFQENKNNFIFFLFSILVPIICVALSVYGEYLYLLYNNSPSESFNRISGLFFDEKVAGSYISKLICITLIFFTLYFKKFRFNNFKKSMVIIMLYFAVFLSLDRMPFIMTSLSLFIFIYFTKNIKFYQKAVSILIFLIFSFLAYINTPAIQGKTVYTLYQLGFNSLAELLIAPAKYRNFSNQNFLETKWGSHFITAYEMGKNSFVVGNGIKTFRKDCSDKSFTSKRFNQGSIEKRCATHPHNIYLELFSEAGIIGLFTFLYFHFLFIKKILTSNKREEKLISLCIMIILFFPIQTTGSYFSTFNGFFYFLNLPVILFICSKKYFRKQNNR